MVASLALAAPGQSETLAEAITAAYRNNPDLQAGRYEVRAADEGVVQARAELRPSIDLNVASDYSRTIEGRTTAANNPFGPRIFTSSRDAAELAIVQPLYTGGRATADREAAEAMVRLARSNLRATEGDLLLAVITAYVSVRQYQAAADLLDASLAELEKLDREVAIRQQAGELTLTDVALADGQLAIAREQRESTEQQRLAARADYVALVGHPPAALSEPAPLPRLPADAVAAYALAEENSPELAGARDAEAGSRAASAAARANGRPSVSVSGVATVSGDASPFYLRNQDKNYTSRVTLSIPLSRGGLVASQVREAEERNSADRSRIESARRALARSVSDAWNQMVAAMRLFAVEEDRRLAASVQLRGMITEYRVGLRNTFDVFYAQQTLRDAELARLQVEATRYTARAALLRRTGLLEVGQVLTGVQLHDPAAHLAKVAERDAVPWEGIVAILDRLGRTHPRRKPLLQPPASPAAAMRPAQRPPVTPAYAPDLVGTPLAETAAPDR